VFATPQPGLTLPTIDFSGDFAGFTVGSSETRWKRENWRTAFVTNMASPSVSPNSGLKVTIGTSL